MQKKKGEENGEEVGIQSLQNFFVSQVDKFFVEHIPIDSFKEMNPVCKFFFICYVVAFVSFIHPFRYVYIWKPCVCSVHCFVYLLYRFQLRIKCEPSIHFSHKRCWIMQYCSDLRHKFIFRRFLNFQLFLNSILSMYCN